MPDTQAAAPESIDLDNLDQYTEEEIEAYNEQVEAHLSQKIEDLSNQEQEAVNLLREQAQATATTETVYLDRPGKDPLELEVRTRFPPSIERKHQQFQTLKETGDVDKAKRIACEMLAEMVVTPGFGNPRVWRIAAGSDGAGMVWVKEAADTVLAPALKRAGASMGN